MPDYSTSKIYKIYSYENDDVYYGSTCDTLCRRMTGHRNSYKRYKEGKTNYLYTSFNILELTSSKIELVENFPCNSKEELLQREGYYIRNNKCVNKIIPNRGKKECDTAYYQANRDTIIKTKREKFVCECGGKYTNAGKSIHLKTYKHINFCNTNINEI